MTGSSDNPAKGRSSQGASIRGTIVAVLIAIACATGACFVDRFHSAATGSRADGDTALSFDARFSANLTPALLEEVRPAQDRSLSVRPELRTAKSRLAQKLLSDSWRTALFGDPALPETASPSPEASQAVVAMAIPLPRARPVQASLETQANIAIETHDSAGAAQPEGRSFLQKLSDMMPGGVKLASLEVDGGLISGGANPASLGFGNQTAIYDLMAHAVYMPDGSRLEAHSGLGQLMDDPEHVDVKDLGATPPNVYDLKAREKIFHGVQALRMIPIGTNQNLGRVGLLVHPYMLGPNGDSNGCVSIRSYETFLNAFQNGVVKRLVVVRSLKDDLSAMQALASQS
jgi:hypothetical protein